MVLDAAAGGAVGVAARAHALHLGVGVRTGDERVLVARARVLDGQVEEVVEVRRDDLERAGAGAGQVVGPAARPRRVLPVDAIVLLVVVVRRCKQNSDFTRDVKISYIILIRETFVQWYTYFMYSNMATALVPYVLSSVLSWDLMSRRETEGGG